MTTKAQKTPEQTEIEELRARITDLETHFEDVYRAVRLADKNGKGNEHIDFIDECCTMALSEDAIERLNDEVDEETKSD